MAVFQPTDAQKLAMKLDGRDILVSAAAGSGKTATLTERIIRRLLTDDVDKRGDISRMLIVTFTRAAAAELRARIASALSEKIAENKDNDYLHKQLLALGSAHICTIDSFYQQTVRANFERLGLPASFRLADEVELAPLKEQLLDGLIDEHYARAATVAGDPNAMLDQLTGNDFALAMDDLLVNRDRGDTAEILLKLFDKLLSFPEELSLLRRGAERLEAQASLPLAQTDEGKIVIQHLIDKLSSTRRSLADVIERWETVPYMSEKYASVASEDLAALTIILTHLRAGEWDAARERALSYEAKAMKRRTKNDPEPPFDNEPLMAVRNAAKATLQELRQNEMEYDEAEYRERMHRTARTQRALYALLSEYDAAIREEKKRRGVLEFSDVRRYMLQLLQDEQGEPTELARSLCERYDAVYIDEYQDVDAVQDRIFALVGAGGKRFMVGDIKQSIYAFRGSDPSLFTLYRKRFPTVKSEDDAALSPDGNSIFMSENFRCDRTVIDTANGVCGYAFEVCADSLDYTAEHDDLKHSKKTDEGYVPTPAQLIVLETPEGDAPRDPAPKTAIRAEAVAVAEEIARLIHSKQTLASGEPIRAGDIAILMRSMTLAGDLVKALKAYGIETSYAPRENLAAHPHMTMLVDLLSVIDDPHDDVALMGLFGSEGSPISLADVLAVRGKATRASSLYDDLCAAIDAPSVWSDETRDKMRAFREHLGRWRELAKTLSIDRLLRKLYGEPFLKHLINTPALIALYDHARNYQNASFCGLYQFLQYFRRLLAKPDGLSVAGLKDNDDAVHIMSIHKSKGLEYPVVFLCSCAKSFNEQDQTATVVFDPALGTATHLFCPDDAAQQSSLTRRAITLCIKERATEEEMRLLYVAMTRARERLYMTAQLSRSRFSTVRAKAERPTRGDRYEILSAKNYLDWILPAVIPPNAALKSDCVELTVLDRYEYRHPHPLATVLATAKPVEPRAAKVEDASKKNKDGESKPISAEGNEAFYRSVLTAHESFVDPHARFRTLPTKAAASKLHASMLDGSWLARAYGDHEQEEARTDGVLPDRDAERDVRDRIKHMQGRDRSFEERLTESQAVSPTERGTAAHLFLQYFEPHRLTELGVEGEIERLVKDGYLPARAAEMLHRDQLTGLLTSDLLALLKRPNVRLRREQHFDRFIPYRSLARSEELAEQVGDYTLYVQGSIDLVVEEADGTLWLVDYKTDRIRGKVEEGGEDAIRRQLLDDHATQLRVYAEAIQGLYGRSPDHILIYSLPLGRSIELTEDVKGGK